MKCYYQVSSIDANKADLFNLYDSKHYTVSMVGCSMIFGDGHLETIIGICKNGQFKRAPYFLGGEPHAFVNDGALIPVSKPLDDFMIAPDSTSIEIHDYLITNY